MRNLFLNVAFLSVTAACAIACSFSVGTKDPKAPQGGTASTPGATPAPAPTPKPPASYKSPAVAHLGRAQSSFLGGARATGGARAGTTPAPAGTGTTPAPAGTTPADPNVPPIMTGTNIFGNGNPDPNGWTGTLFTIPAGATKLPDLNGLAATGFLFSPKLDVAPQALTGGFPGIDAAKNENFAIRWEAPLVVSKEGDVEFRVLADDGAVLKIDGMTIVDNDGSHSPAASKTGPVHLVVGTHAITVDYFQASGQVALQVFAKPAGGTEAILPLQM